MIKLHRLNGAEVSLNPELIEVVEATPDTSIGLATGNRYVVRESVDEVTAKIIEYRRLVYADKKAVNPIEGYRRS